MVSTAAAIFHFFYYLWTDYVDTTQSATDLKELEDLSWIVLCTARKCEDENRQDSALTYTAVADRQILERRQLLIQAY